ncbi:MAG: ABC transporter ATP-binding protein [bacterium]
MIEVKELTKSYGNQLAVDRLSFRVSPGEIVGVLGPNGAGKSTTMKILTGYLAPDGGQASLAGFDIEREPVKAQRLLGYLPENAPLYPEMTAQNYLRFIGQIRGLSKQSLDKALERVVEDCALAAVINKPNAYLSKGYRQRLGLGAAIIHDPAILILDEPTTGLDPTQIVEIRKLIKRLGKKKTVLICSHVLSEVQSTCDRAIILNQGRKIADGRLQDLCGQATQRIIITLKTDRPGAVSFCRSLSAERVDYQETPEGIRCRLEVTEKREEIFQLAAQRQIVLVELSSEPASLENTFLSLLKNQEIK